MHYAEWHYAECRYDECHFAECRYAECRGAINGGAKYFPFIIDMSMEKCPAMQLSNHFLLPNTLLKWKSALFHFSIIIEAGNTKGGSTTVPLTSCLTGLDLCVLRIKTKFVSCHTADSKPVEQEVNGTMILPPLVFPDRGHH
jgi:hypothetical protein